MVPVAFCDSRWGCRVGLCHTVCGMFLVAGCARCMYEGCTRLVNGASITDAVPGDMLALGRQGQCDQPAVV